MVDSSVTAIGGVLQICLKDIWSPIAFFSRRLNVTQRKYSAFDKELLAMYLAVKHFLYFIEGKKFAIFTDHKPLIKAFSSVSSQTLPRRVRQMNYISEFSTDLRYVQGSQNFVADTLSRIEINGLEILQDGIDYKKMASAQKTDKDILHSIQNPSESNLQLCDYPVANCEDLLCCDVSTHVIRPLIPLAFRKIIFDKIHNVSHPGIMAY